MVEGVLCNIGHAHVGVLPHSALIWQQLSCEQLDHGGFASAVCAHTGHTCVERALQGDI